MAAAPMRVLLDCRMATWTGVGRYTRGLGRALGRRDDIELIELTAPGSPAISPASTVRECAGHPFSLAGARAFGRAVSELRPDVLHCPHFPTPFPLAHPLVVTVHDFIPLAVAGAVPSGIHRLGFRLLMRRAVRGADRIITLSEYSATATRAFYAPASGRISVIPAAADDFASGPIGVLPPKLRGLGRYVFALGNPRPHKGLDVLLRAWAAVEEDLPPDLSLVLAGNEPEGFVRSALGDGAALKRIVWAGRPGDEELRALYTSALAFVFPSSYEGFGLPPLEAMALGTPVVCSNATSVPEVVGDAAITVEAGDAEALGVALVRVASDPALARDLSARGLARAAGFSWERTAELTMAVYAEATHARA